METLVVASHHRNHHQYYGRSRSNGSTKFDSFGSAPSGSFRGISCRTFQSGAGLLPTPLKSKSFTKNALSDPLSPKTPSPTFNEHKSVPKSNAQSSSAVIPIKINFENEVKFHFSERWAGPAYSNSPPPSSLPVPKFSMRPKRTVSLDLPTLASEIDARPIAKSAPASPTRGRSPSPIDLFDSHSPSSLFGHPSPRDTAFQLLWSFFYSLESVHQIKLFTVVPGVAFGKIISVGLCRHLVSLEVVHCSDVLNFSWITIAFLHCDLMRASLPFSAFCIS